MPQLDYFRRLLKDEIIQRREEGCDVSGFEERLASVNDIAAAEKLYAELMALQPQSPYVEPSDLAGIRAERPNGPRRVALNLSEAGLRDKILGGWLGRCAGCQLGKPVEGWHYHRIREYLQRANAFPLDYYFPSSSVDAEGKEWQAGCQLSTREHIKFADRDDDQDYTIFGLYVLERHGLDFTTRHVGQEWLNCLPYYRVYTAERQAYKNLVEGFDYPDCATRWNPYREWIGAQIRADGWGYAAPGYLEKAAEFAFRDAAVSHVKNGIYGEMFMSAAIAAAFVTDDIETCLRLAASEVPKNTRFSEMVEDCLRWSKEIPDWDAAWAKVNEKYGVYHWVHTINNAALVLLGLLYGKKDYEKTICYAVMGGWDTDCNGATAGSILGVMLGAKSLPTKWIGPLNDTVKSAVFGFAECRITALAERTYEVAQNVKREA